MEITITVITDDMEQTTVSPSFEIAHENLWRIERMMQAAKVLQEADKAADDF